jgi:hypothetical protein
MKEEIAHEMNKMSETDPGRRSSTIPRTVWAFRAHLFFLNLSHFFHDVCSKLTSIEIPCLVMIR